MSRLPAISVKPWTAGVFAFAAAVVLAVFAISALPFAASAQTGVGQIAATSGQVAQSAGLVTTPLATLVGRIIYAFLGLLGVIAVVLMIYAGFVWMTAQGSEEKITLAKRIMTNAVIGLVIIFSSFSIVYMILSLVEDDGSYGGPGGQARELIAYFGTSGRGQPLGNGILEYHYPENGQSDVARWTRISATFKRPLVLSTVFKNYDDRGTYDLSDDVLCASQAPCETGTAVVPGETALELNVDNVKIVANSALAGAGSGGADQQFDSRYEAAIVSPAPTVTVTPVPAEFDETAAQTVVIRLAAPIGSPSSEINYRVAFRGGESGIRVWRAAVTGAAEQESAFPQASADGGYFWQFTTGTTLDAVPPRVMDVVPRLTPVPGVPESSVLARNQLLQIHFNEAVDPTTIGGVLGAGGGFNLLEVRATCLAGLPCDPAYRDGAIVPGTFYPGNRYRSTEFVPSLACEGVTENSCGETVYCLPRNVRLEVIAKAATIDNQAPYSPEPPAALLDNGVVDMSGNSLDGNRDGSAQGPLAPTQPGGRTSPFYLNAPASDTAGFADTVRWEFQVGSDVDLSVPLLREIDPPALPDASATYPAGPSAVPVDQEIALVWNKVMSLSSMRSGSFDEQGDEFNPDHATLVLRADECAKSTEGACTSVPCPCADLPAPGFFLESQLVADPGGTGAQVSRIVFRHPTNPFLTANDLGYNEAEVESGMARIPVYVPIARARLKDDKQNCFWPSQYRPSDDATACNLAVTYDAQGRPVTQNSCCNRTGESDGTFLSVCAPVPESAITP